MDTGQMIADRIAALIEQRGTNNRAVSLAAGMSPTGVRDIVNRKTKNPTFANLQKIADVLEVDVTDIINASKPSVEIAGKVGAGAKVPIFEAYEKGTGPRVEVVRGIPTSGIVAVEVQGDSMAPVYAPGEILLYTRLAEEGVPDDAIGRICVIEDEDGHGWVKQLRNGSEPGLFHLVSVNPGAETMHDRKIKWAARVRFNLPPDVVRKV